MSATDVWVAKDDGIDIIRATSIAGVGRDYHGNITVRLSGSEHAVVTLVADNAHDGPHTPDDFHLQLLRVIHDLSDSTEPAIVRPNRDEQHGWRWQAARL